MWWDFGEVMRCSCDGFVGDWREIRLMKRGIERGFWKEKLGR